VVLVFLAAVWAVILIPSLLRRRRNGDSISHFHHQLGILQRGDTPAVPPPYRLQCVPSSRSVTVNGAPLTTPPVLTVVGSDKLPKPALAYLGAQGPATGAQGPATGAQGPATIGAPIASASHPPAEVAQDSYRVSDAFSRQVARKRRRDTLMVLVLTFAFSLFIGMIPATRMLWVVTAISGVAMVAYVALLVHLRGVAEERERKLHYLRPEPEYGTGVLTGGLRDDDAYRDARYGHPVGRSVAAH
jgi:membrane protein YdbS with pleckstrin-like domain